MTHARTEFETEFEFEFDLELGGIAALCPPTRQGRLRRAMVLAITLVSAVFASCSDGETALTRGDRFWADSNFDAALAEYRLAVSQSGGDAESLARTAHAYAVAGQFEPARQNYDRLLAEAPAWSTQAAMDYLSLARRARERGDEFGMASAAEAALAASPDLALAEFAEPLARYYRDTGQPGQALAQYMRALVYASPDSAPRLLYEIGLLHEEQNRCGAALSYFRAFEEQVAPTLPLEDQPAPAREDYRRRRAPSAWRTLLGEARWHIGNCSYRLAQEARDQGRFEHALEYLDAVLELGLPENIQDQAWLDAGELYYALGRQNEALVAFRRVVELNPSLTGQLVERAQRRIDEIRFGRPPPPDTVPPGR